MNKDTINITIAEAVGAQTKYWRASWLRMARKKTTDGWKTKEDLLWLDGRDGLVIEEYEDMNLVPNYFEDLNAIHSAMLTLDDWKEGGDFENHLFRVLIRDKRERGVGHEGVSTFDKVRAEPHHLAEAFLLTKNLWTPTGEENEH